MKKFCFIFSFLLFISCQEREVHDLPFPEYTRKLVANSLLSNEQDISVAVSFSVPSLGTDNPAYLDNAIVQMKEDGVLLGTFTYDVFDKKYSIPVKPKQGSIYELTVSHPSYPNIYAVGQLPGLVQFNHAIYVDSVGLDSSGGTLAAIRFTIIDPAADKNYYRLGFTYFNNAANEWLPIDFETSDEVLLSPSTVKEGTGGYVFDDGLFVGRSKTFEIRFPKGTATSTPRYMVVVDALTQDYYRYRTSLNQFNENKDNPFAESVIIHTNIQNGLGIFAGSITQRDTIY